MSVMSAPSASARTRTVSPYLLLTLTPFFWACNWVLGRGMSSSIPPMAMTFYRWLFAILILAPFAAPHLKREWPIVWRHRRVLLLLGIVGVGSHNALAYLGLNYTTAMNGVILNSFIPVMIISLSWIFLRQRLARVQLAGVGVSLAGVLAILSQGSLATLASFQLNRGDLFVIVSMLLWSIYTICLRWRPAGLHMLTFLFVIACIGDLGILPFYLAEMALGNHVHVYADRFRGVARHFPVLFGTGLHLLESWRRTGRGERCRSVRPPDAGVRHDSRVAVSGRAPARVSPYRHCAHPHRHLRAPAAAGRGRSRRRWNDVLPAERRGRLLGFYPAILVVKADDVVLAQVVAALHLDHHQRVAALVLEAMLGLARDERRFVGVHLEDALAIGYLARRH